MAARIACRFSGDSVGKPFGGFASHCLAKEASCGRLKPLEVAPKYGHSVFCAQAGAEPIAAHINAVARSRLPHPPYRRGIFANPPAHLLMVVSLTRRRSRCDAAR